MQSLKDLLGTLSPLWGLWCPVPLDLVTVSGDHLVLYT